MNKANKRVQRLDVPCKDTEIRYCTNSGEPSTIWVYLTLLSLLYVYREYFNSVNACLAFAQVLNVQQAGCKT